MSTADKAERVIDILNNIFKIERYAIFDEWLDVTFNNRFRYKINMEDTGIKEAAKMIARTCIKDTMRDANCSAEYAG